MYVYFCVLIFKKKNRSGTTSEGVVDKSRGGFRELLTIALSKSRFLFTAKRHYKENFLSFKQEFTKVFRKYGIPKQIHTEDGSPFKFVAAI